MRISPQHFAVFMLLVYGVVGPPVTEKKKKEHKDDNQVDQQAIEVEYKRYLDEVVQVLEADKDFKERISKANPDDIRTGKIANDIEFLNHNVRTKLDELKRQELERLRHLAVQEYELSNGIDKKHMKIPLHLDSDNPHTFEAEDLRKLIVQTTKELEEADLERKKEFKEYELQKELQYQEQLNHLDEKNRVEAQKQHEELMKKHNEHVPIHHPGSKHQLEQVWEEQDHMDAENFNPKTFFHLHDLDGNGVWDPVEVKALFKKELDKMYDPNAPEDDIRERYEEMERMREHVFNETDTNKDQLISYKEFYEQTKRKEFEEDPAWEPIDQKQHPVYTDEEYRQYAAQHQDEIRRLIEQGAIPAAPPGYIPIAVPNDHMQYPPGAHPQLGSHIPPPGAHPNAYPQGGGYHPNAIPQGHMNAPPQYHQNPGVQPPNQYHQNVGVPPPNQYHQNAGVQPPNQYHQNAGVPPPNQYHQNAGVPQPNQFQQHQDPNIHQQPNSANIGASDPQHHQQQQQQAPPQAASSNQNPPAAQTHEQPNSQVHSAGGVAQHS